MIVVDTNVIVCSLVDGPQAALARRVQALDAVWRLPDLWRHACLNVLNSYVVHGGMALGHASTLWVNAMELFGGCSWPVDMLRTLRIAATHKISAYDAQFICLAQTLKVPCITEDRKLLAKFPEMARSMRAFCSAKGSL